MPRSKAILKGYNDDDVTQTGPPNTKNPRNNSALINMEKSFGPNISSGRKIGSQANFQDFSEPEAQAIHSSAKTCNARHVGRNKYRNWDNRSSKVALNLTSSVDDRDPLPAETLLDCFQWGIDAARKNSWFLHQLSIIGAPQLHFICSLAKIVLKRNTVPRSIATRKSLPVANDDLRYDGLHHWPKKVLSRYHRCKLCYGRTNMSCEKCDVFLHIKCFRL